MRIISKTNDYYDSAQAFGQDQSVIYNRKKRIIELVETELGILDDFNFFRLYLSNNSTIDRHVLGFCGSIYPVYELYLDSKYHYAFGARDIDKILSVKKYKVERKDWNKENYRGISNRDRVIGESIKIGGFQSIKYLDIFVKYDTPIWLFNPDKQWEGIHKGWRHYWKLVINPTLKRYNFAKVIDPYNAYQEIAMFMEGALAHEKIPDPTNVPDEYLAKAKGFDSWSFRKQPTKKGIKAKKRN